MTTYSKEWHFDYCMGEVECKHGDPECPHNHAIYNQECNCTAKPMKSTNDKIEKILAQETSIGIGQPIIEARNQIKQLIKETLQECIGEEEPEEEFTKSGVNLAVVKGNTVRNQLRKEALNKLDSLLDPQED